jgi:hypothetical protein
MKYVAPRFTKGQMLTPTAHALDRREYGTRKATQAEVDAWYKQQYAIAPHDCAGEPWIHSGTTGVALVEGMRLEVVRGACTARSGWHTMKGYCEVRDLVSGQVFQVDRRHLMVA